MQTLVDDILPAARALIPQHLKTGFLLHVVGANSPPGFMKDVQQRALASTTAAKGGTVPVVRFHGWMSDSHLELLYWRVKVVAAPLLSGAGVKGKVRKHK